MGADNLPKSLQIPDKRLVTCLNSIKESVRILWDSPLLQHYTKHGLDHSKRIIEILEKLLDAYPNLLNVHERFILLAAVYLHDIGMQSPTHADLPYQSEYTLEELEIVRAKHNEASAKMILESISQTSELSLGLKRCERYAKYIATLSRYHRKRNINEVNDTSLAGEDIRLPLLIALLRLGDELDQDYRRVNMEILKLRDIPVGSKFYWWSHHYVNSISIRNGKTKLYFIFPEKYRGDKVIDVFRNKVRTSVQKQLDEVYNILDDYGIRLHPDVIIEEENYTTEGELELIPDDLLEHIKENILETPERTQELSVKTGVTWFVDGVPYSDDVEVVKCLTNVVKFVNEGRNLEAVEEIEKSRVLTMAPKERMIFSTIAGNCYYILGKLSEAEEYYKDTLKISERKGLQEIYKDDIILARAATLGNIGLIYSNLGDLEEALKYLKEALTIHKEIGYKQGEANQLGNIGLIYSNLGDLEEALKYHKEALTIDKEIEYKQGEASDLGNIGLIYSNLGDLGEALKYHKEALTIHKEIGYKQGEANQLGNIGLIYSNLGDLEEALKYHKEALTIHKEIGYKQGEASGLGNIGLIYSNLGDLEEALKYLKEALTIDKEIGYKQGEANQLSNIGLIYSNLGDLEEALKYLKEALTIHKEIGYKQGEASDLGNIGLIYSNLGDLEEALKYHKEALTIDKEIGYKQGEASDLGNIGLIYSNLGDLEEALKYHKEALTIDKEIGYKQGEASDLGNIGLIYSNLRDLEEALKYHKEALTIHKEIGYKQGEANQLGNIGLIYSNLGDLEEALKYHKEALTIDKEIGYKQGEANQLGNIGLIYSKLGDLEEALKYLKEALEIFKFAAPLSIVQTLNNVATIYFKKQNYEIGFEYLARAVSSSSSLEQFNNVLSLLLRIVRELIIDNAWGNLEKIHSTYTSGLIKDENWLNFFMAIYEYATYKKTSDTSHNENYKAVRQKLNPSLMKLLDEILEVRR